MSARDPARAVKVSICCGLFGEARIGRSGISGTRRRLIGALRYVRGKHQITGDASRIAMPRLPNGLERLL